MRPKLHHVAELAGVSEATVSRVINAKPGVAESTRRAVLDVLSDLGYREVPTRSTDSGLIGIVTPELGNPIFPLLAQTIEARLARHELMSLVCPSTSETIAEQDYLDHFVETRAAGIIVVNGRYAQDGFGYDPYFRIVDTGIPLVLVNGIFPGCPLPAVAVDLAAAARLGVQHLVRLGHTRIGCLTGPHRYSTSQLFVNGYRAAMREVNGGYDVVSETLFTLEGGRAGMAKLLEEGCTGVVAASDLMALGAITAARSWGAKVPEDVSIIGSDGTPLSTLTDPPLTTLRQPVERMAAATVSALLAQSNGDGMLSPQLFQPELVAGASAATVKAAAPA
ncbi:MAG: LacI family DNA-binding transcriptional regulator [Acidimicrobiia bacterium]|nr:LacI family DNA-binding transcriptional regulator [Acidimicrobiia bacterium]